MKLHLVCGKCPLREILNYVLVTRDQCVATDAHALAAVPTEAIFDADFIAGIPETGVLIHRTDWPQVLKTGTAVSWKTGLLIACHTGNKRPVFIEAEDRATFKVSYPEWERLVPKKDQAAPVTNVAFDAKILANLQDALGLNSVLLYTRSSAGAPILVTSTGDVDKTDVGQYGIIMPVRFKTD